MQIDSERAEELAEALAVQRKVSVSEAVIQALEEVWKRETEKQGLADRLRDIATELAALGRPGGRAMTKNEVDEMWGH